MFITNKLILNFFSDTLLFYHSLIIIHEKKCHSVNTSFVTSFMSSEKSFSIRWPLAQCKYEPTNQSVNQSELFPTLLFTEVLKYVPSLRSQDHFHLVCSTHAEAKICQFLNISLSLFLGRSSTLGSFCSTLSLEEDLAIHVVPLSQVVAGEWWLLFYPLPSSLFFSYTHPFIIVGFIIVLHGHRAE